MRSIIKKKIITLALAPSLLFGVLAGGTTAASATTDEVTAIDEIPLAPGETIVDQELGLDGDSPEIEVTDQTLEEALEDAKTDAPSEEPEVEAVAPAAPIEPGPTEIAVENAMVTVIAAEEGFETAYVASVPGVGQIPIETSETQNLEALETGDTISFTIDTAVEQPIEDAVELETFEEVVAATIDANLEETEAVQVQNITPQASQSVARTAQKLNNGEVHVVMVGENTNYTKAKAEAQVNGVMSYWNKQTQGVLKYKKVTRTEKYSSSNVDVCNYNAIVNDWTKRTGLGSGDYYQSNSHLVIFFQNKNCNIRWSGLGTVGEPNYGGISWINLGNSASIDFNAQRTSLVHELGHNHGLKHSSARFCTGSTKDTVATRALTTPALAGKTNCWDAEYYDLYSPMGAGSSGKDPVALTGAHQETFKSLKASQQKVLSKSAGPTRVTLKAMGTSAANSGVKTARFKTGPNEEVFLEFRNGKEQDASVLGNGYYYNLYNTVTKKNVILDSAPVGVRAVKLYNNGETVVLLDQINGRYRNTFGAGRTIHVAGLGAKVVVEKIEASQATIRVDFPKPPAPTKPSIVKGDVVVKDSAGNLWNYGNLYTKGKNRVKIGSGWQNFKSLTVTDFNADGYMDIVSTHSNGKLYLYKGARTGGFTSSVIGTSGWSNLKITAAKMKKTDKYPSLLVRFTNGKLYHYNNTNGKSLAAGRVIGSGWQGFTHVNWAYFDDDGNIDAIAQTKDGKQILYRTNGKGFINEKRKTIGTGWKNYTPVSSFNHESGKSGFIAKDTAGKLYYYTASGNKLTRKKVIGTSGWKPYTLMSQSS